MDFLNSRDREQATESLHLPPVIHCVLQANKVLHDTSRALSSTRIQLDAKSLQFVTPCDNRVNAEESPENFSGDSH